jgi:hypothetical protein
MPGLGLMSKSGYKSSPPGRRSTSYLEPPRLPYRGGCQRKTSARYMRRLSPPYSANEEKCRGTTKLGNDGLPWKSTENVRGIFYWKRVK